MSDLNLHTAADEIAALVRPRNCVAWIGSGLSISAGYPGWPVLIDRLCKACGVQPLEKHRRGDSEALMDKAQQCKEADSTAYLRTVTEAFPQPNHTRLAFQQLLRLPFKGYVTTNFDPLLSTVGELNDRRTFAYPDLPLLRLEHQPPPIYYIHGHVDPEQPSKSNLVLASSDFDTAYSGPTSFFLGQLLIYQQVLFLGAGLQEPAIDALFRRVHDIHLGILRSRSEATLPQRRILLPARYLGEGSEAERNKAQEAIEEQRFRELGVGVVRYQVTTEDHSEIEELLRLVGSRVKVPLIGRPSIGLGADLPT